VDLFPTDTNVVIEARFSYVFHSFCVIIISLLRFFSHRAWVLESVHPCVELEDSLNTSLSVMLVLEVTLDA
jgi:hypothetical protein